MINRFIKKNKKLVIIFFFILVLSVSLPIYICDNFIRYKFPLGKLNRAETAGEVFTGNEILSEQVYLLGTYYTMWLPANFDGASKEINGVVDGFRICVFTDSDPNLEEMMKGKIPSRIFSSSKTKVKISDCSEEGFIKYFPAKYAGAYMLNRATFDTSKVFTLVYQLTFGEDEYLYISVSGDDFERLNDEKTLLDLLADSVDIVDPTDPDLLDFINDSIEE
ncbi:MAG: hypothetical protein K6F84_08320 [Lachnospiraceae bacterium]|nr:hypothetical protein [Lachnospiraceae bacterium]